MHSVLASTSASLTHSSSPSPSPLVLPPPLRLFSAPTHTFPSVILEYLDFFRKSLYPLSARCPVAPLNQRGA